MDWGIKDRESRDEEDAVPYECLSDTKRRPTL